jgi:hypothetical protein
MEKKSFRLSTSLATGAKGNQRGFNTLLNGKDTLIATTLEDQLTRSMHWNW